MDRRTTIKWMLSAATLAPWSGVLARDTEARTNAVLSTTAQGYGSDPKLIDTYHPGQLWPLTFNVAQRATAKALSDLIIPADENSPSASDVGVVDFLDEWVSAPYERQRKDRTIVLDGFAWLDKEAVARFGAKKSFAQLEPAQQTSICDDICHVPDAKPQFADAAKFFARYRDLTAGGFYTTPQGRKDLRYVGNVPLPRFDGPPLEVLKKVGLA
jgi:hypothetical protein